MPPKKGGTGLSCYASSHRQTAKRRCLAPSGFHPLRRAQQLERDLLRSQNRLSQGTARRTTGTEQSTKAVTVFACQRNPLLPQNGCQRTIPLQTVLGTKGDATTQSKNTRQLWCFALCSVVSRPPACLQLDSVCRPPAIHRAKRLSRLLKSQQPRQPCQHRHRCAFGQPA